MCSKVIILRVIKSLLKTLWEKEKLLVTSNFSFFPQCFPPISITFCNFHQNKPWFLRVCRTSLLKTLWEKEKLLVTSNFSFFPQCFPPISITFCNFHQNKPWFLRRNACYEQFFTFSTVFSIHLESFLPFSSTLKLLSAISLSLEESKICCLGKG